MDVKSSAYTQCKQCGTTILRRGLPQHSKTYKCRLWQIENKYFELCDTNVADNFDHWARAFVSVMPPAAVTANYESNVRAFMRRRENMSNAGFARPSDQALRFLIKNRGVPVRAQPAALIINAPGPAAAAYVIHVPLPAAQPQPGIHAPATDAQIDEMMNALDN